MEVIAGFISLISLIVFFVMAKNLSIIRKDTEEMWNILHLYARRDGVIWKCSRCRRDNPSSKTKCSYCPGEKPSTTP